MARLLVTRGIRRILRLVSSPYRGGRGHPKIGRLPQNALVSARPVGKRGGVRVIYFNRLEEGHIWLLMMYSKNVRSNVDGRILAKIRETIDAKDD